MGRAGWIAGFATAGVALALGGALLVGARPSPDDPRAAPSAASAPSAPTASPSPPRAPPAPPAPRALTGERRATPVEAPSPVAGPVPDAASPPPPLAPAKQAINAADAAMLDGDPTTADALLLGVIDDPATSAPIRSFAIYKRASVLVDLGREDEARAALREVIDAPLGEDPQSRWLVDQATRDLAEME